jgi:hypothetical protein
MPMSARKARHTSSPPERQRVDQRLREVILKLPLAGVSV